MLEFLETASPLVLYGGAFVFGILLVLGVLFLTSGAQGPPTRAAKKTDAPPPRPPPVVRDMTEEELARGTGVDGAPVYVCVNGDIYEIDDEEKKKMYSPPGTGYSIFAGREAAVPLAMAILEVDKIPAGKTVADLTAHELDSLRSWKSHYDNNYPKVGRLVDATGKHLQDPRV